MLTWSPAPMSMDLPEGSFIARLSTLHVFTAKRHNKGYRLRTRLHGVARGGKICYCHNLTEVKQRAEEELKGWMKRTGLELNPTSNATKADTG